MHWNARTFVRLFLLVGGSFFLVTGALGGEPVDVVIGVVSVGLGGVGLAVERREAAE